MALRTGQVGMRAGKWESRQVVVECSRQPAAGCMAASAARTEPAIVSIVTSMAGKAAGGCAFENVIDVAALTSNRDVFTG